MTNNRKRQPIRGGLVPAVLLVLVVRTGGPALARQFVVPPVRTPIPSATPTPVPPGSITVEMALVSGKKRLPGDDSVAWIPAIEAKGDENDHVKIAQNKKQFEPRIAVVSVGSTVDFPNYDRVFHNVFSLSSPQPFDLGLYRRGKSESVRFSRPGLIQIFCNIHPHMVAYLMVVDSHIHGAADAQGRIALAGIPPGPTVVEGWNVRGGMWSREVAVRPGRTSTVQVDLDISSWRDVPHLNKYGKEYPPPDDDDFRY